MIKRLTPANEILLVLLACFFIFVIHNVLSKRYSIRVINKTDKKICVQVTDSKNTLRNETLSPGERLLLYYLPEPAANHIVRITNESGNSLCLLEINNLVISSLKRNKLTFERLPYILIVSEVLRKSENDEDN
jgi:hypothetical protein